MTDRALLAPFAPAAPSQAARARIALGPFAAEAEVAVTPAGMIAMGGAVAMVLLAVAPIILATAVARRAGRRGPTT